MPVPAAPAETPAEAAPEETSSRAGAPAGGDETGETAGGDTAAEGVAGSPGNVPPVVPSVDEVRVDGDGILIVAGRAAPGSRVRVLLDGAEAGVAQADARGAFAAVAVIGPSDAARVLTLEAIDGDVVTASAGEVILAPVAAPIVVAEAAPASEPVAGQGVSGDAGSGSGPLVQSGPAAAPEKDAAAAAGSNAGAPATDIVAATDPDAGQTVAPDAADDTTETPSQVAGGAGVAETTAKSEAFPTTPGATDLASVSTAPATASGGPATAENSGTVATTQQSAGADPQTTTDPAPAATAQAPQIPQAPQTGTTARQEIAVLKSDAEGVSLLQNAPTPPDSIQLDTIGYSADGVVQLSGRAGRDAREVRVYLDNRAILSLPMDAGGIWRGEVPDVDAGIYTLRVDAVSAQGEVTSRIETPFKREEPDVLAEAQAANQQQDGTVRAITVQAGDTLWAIARDRYGEGLLYVQVFEANRTSIRDPDLIYPGQVFDLPVDN
ncbi:LysM peptidoglycan-binding domain-containing protein [Roseobacter ponti]|uniref:LysM peptidoglycan-binding domain-containing protein n=2 Tax=Roseobacter ponti TaxID=1891787 RepID=A0A858SZ31_9RHOB|nr:LysM peptidoglycan-binding domain-containing protein [Roseobacter ponti]